MGGRRKYLALMDPARAKRVFSDEYKCMFTKDDEPMVFAIQTALDKQTPMEARIDHNGLPICPNCSGYINFDWPHCVECGQRLKWSEKEKV